MIYLQHQRSRASAAGSTSCSASPLRRQPAALAARNFLFNLHRVHFQAAVALAAAVRQHVRGRNHLSCCSGLWAATGARRHGLRRRCLALGWAIFHILIVAAAGLHFHDADRRLHRDGARTPLTVTVNFQFRKENTMEKLQLLAHGSGLHRHRHRPHDRPRRARALASASGIMCSALPRGCARASRR